MPEIFRRTTMLVLLAICVTLCNAQPRQLWFKSTGAWTEDKEVDAFVQARAKCGHENDRIHYFIQFHNSSAKQINLEWQAKSFNLRISNPKKRTVIESQGNSKITRLDSLLCGYVKDRGIFVTAVRLPDSK